jgi:hypothetical protein
VWTERDFSFWHLDDPVRLKVLCHIVMAGGKHYALETCSMHKAAYRDTERVCHVAVQLGRELVKGCAVAEGSSE